MKPTSEIFDERPPANPEAERWVVGSAILKPSVLDDLDFLQPADFYDETLSAVFGWLHDRHRRGEPIDMGLLGQHFNSDDWAARIAEIIQAAPDALHAVHYGRIVARLAKHRRLQEIGDNLVQDAHRAEGEPEEILERIETALGGNPPHRGRRRAGHADRRGGPSDSADRRNPAAGQSAGVPTGLISFRQRSGRTVSRRADHLGRKAGRRQDFSRVAGGAPQRRARPAGLLRYRSKCRQRNFRSGWRAENREFLIAWSESGKFERRRFAPAI